MVIDGNTFYTKESYDKAVKESSEKATEYCKEHDLKEGTNKYSIAFRNVFNLWMYNCSDEI